MNGINKDAVLSLVQIATKVKKYEASGRQPAMSSGSSLPLTIQDKDGVLTGNYQLIEYTKDNQDMFLCLAELTCGKYTDTTAVNHNETRLKKNQAIKVSVKEVNGIRRNRIVFV
tara:strand:- start:151 stop:492 length:342 start_codon:yes stop_codon:yes gene_type:complete